MEAARGSDDRRWPAQGVDFQHYCVAGDTDVRTTAVTADVFGSGDAVLRSGSMAEAWKKVHPNRNVEETMNALGRLREIARRELLVVEKRVASATTVISQTK